MDGDAGGAGSAVRAMAGGGVAASAVLGGGRLRAVRGFSRCTTGGDLAHKRPVASDAVGFKHPGVLRRDPNRILDLHHRESHRMVPAIANLGGELVDGIVVRQMAIIAGGRGMMGTMPPAFVLRLHDVAVPACARIVGKIGRTVGGPKGEETGAEKNADDQCQGDRTMAETSLCAGERICGEMPSEGEGTSFTHEGGSAPVRGEAGRGRRTGAGRR